MLLCSGCKKDNVIESKNEPTRLTLTLQDISCIDAVLSVKPQFSDRPYYCRVYRDSVLLYSDSVYNSDVIVIDSLLLPKKHYFFKAFAFHRDGAKDSSNIVSVVTLDTTSHEFSFVIDTFGVEYQGIYNKLFSASLISNDLIWVVGKIDKGEKDTNGYNITYNAIRWNGSKWDLQQVPMRNYQRSTFGFHPLQAIYASTENNIYVVSSDQMAHYDGTKWGSWSFLFTGNGDSTFGNLQQLWGYGGNDCYGIADRGNVYHFTTIDEWSRTKLPLQFDLCDIFGKSDGSTVIAIGSYNDRYGTGLYRYKNNQWELMYDGSPNQKVNLQDTISGRLYSAININDKYFYLMTFAGLYRVNYNSRGEGRRIYRKGYPINQYVENIRGVQNDLMMVGDGGLMHFNGYSWKTYEQFHYLKSHFIFQSLEYRNGIGIAVGHMTNYLNTKAIAIRITK